MSSNVLYFHNILGREEAEERLVAEGIDKTYLARRSPLNGDCYILSYQSNGKFRHVIVNRKPASRDLVDLENVFVDLREMVDTNSDCENAVVFALSTDGQGEAGHLPFSQEVREAGPGHSQPDVGEDAHQGQGAAATTKRRNRKAKRITPVEPQTVETVDRPTVRPNIIQLRPQCHVCHLSFDNKMKRKDHLNDHKVKKYAVVNNKCLISIEKSRANTYPLRLFPQLKIPLQVQYNISL